MGKESVNLFSSCLSSANCFNLGKSQIGLLGTVGLILTFRSNCSIDDFRFIVKT